MTTSHIAHVTVALASVLFAGVTLATWIAPEQAAHYLGLDVIRTTGLAALRADLGGLFGALSLLCGATAKTRSRHWAFASLAVLAAIVTGRAVGWIGMRTFTDSAAELMVEIAVMAALLHMVRASSLTAATPRQRTRLAIVAAAGLLLVAVIGMATWVSPGLQQWIFDRAAQQRAGRINTAPLEDDALRVAVCGSSAPLPSDRRAKTCVTVFAGGKFYVVDVGPESVENLVMWGIPLSSVGGVLLTHFHSDHIGDLGELNLQTWAGGRPAPLAVYGGPGVEAVVEGFTLAYQLDQGYRTVHHTDRIMPPGTWPMTPHVVELVGTPTPAKDRTAPVLTQGALRITAIEVDHTPITPAYAYRFDYKGRSVLVTGDLKFHPPLVDAARNVDILVSEAISVEMTRSLGKGASAAGRDRTAAIMHDIEDYHITPQQAVQMANDARVKLLVFYHLLPAPDGMLPRRLFAQGVDEARRGDWTIADDGSLYTLPIGSDAVEIGHVSK